MDTNSGPNKTFLSLGSTSIPGLWLWCHLQLAVPLRSRASSRALAPWQVGTGSVRPQLFLSWVLQLSSDLT